MGSTGGTLCFTYEYCIIGFQSGTTVFYSCFQYHCWYIKLLNLTFILQIVKLCRENELYSALIYLFNKGLDDFKSPLEELLIVAQDDSKPNARSLGYGFLYPKISKVNARKLLKLLLLFVIIILP